LVTIAFPFAFHISVFSIHSSSLLDFIRLFLTVMVSAPRATNPPPLPGLGTSTGPQRTLRRSSLIENNKHHQK